MQIFDSADAFLVERTCVRSRVEIEITCLGSAFWRYDGTARGNPIRFTSKYLVASLATQDHLDAHGFDLATEEVHRRARSHGGHVIRFQMVYHFRNGVQAFLNREYVFVVHGTQIVSRFPCREVVGGVLEADRK